MKVRKHNATYIPLPGLMKASTRYTLKHSTPTVSYKNLELGTWRSVVCYSITLVTGIIRQASAGKIVI